MKVRLLEAEVDEVAEAAGVVLGSEALWTFRQVSSVSRHPRLGQHLADMDRHE